MAYKIKRTDSEIDNVLNSANAWEEHGGSSVPGMSYEQGVKQGIEWVTGASDEIPIEEEPA
ncbi:MAG TPA: hypothetical protein VK789_28125 [Bryobacteraceae bacterium]|jgi:hypothetical protein|nr:hypothetical protein [Bryobacteraceae bacterium]